VAGWRARCCELMPSRGGGEGSGAAKTSTGLTMRAGRGDFSSRRDSPTFDEPRFFVAIDREEFRVPARSSVLPPRPPHGEEMAATREGTGEGRGTKIVAGCRWQKKPPMPGGGCDPGRRKPLSPRMISEKLRSGRQKIRLRASSLPIGAFCLR